MRAKLSTLSTGTRAKQSGKAFKEPIGGKKQIVDTGAEDQVAIHRRSNRKLPPKLRNNKTITIKKTRKIQLYDNN